MTDFNYIKNFMNEYLFEEDAIKDISDVYDKLNSTDGFADAVKKAEEYMFSDETVDPKSTYIAVLTEFAEKAGVNPRPTYLIYHIMATKRLKEIYDAMNIEKQVQYDTLKDLYCKMHECKMITGVYGLYTPWWLYGYYKATRFAFGALQFETGVFEYESYKIGDTELKKGDLVIKFHIPRGNKQFDRKARYDSYKKAYGFFKNEFKTDKIPFTCNTWLIYPPHREFLNPQSNIVDFMDDFEIVYTYETEGNLWRIFGVEYKGNPDEMPETTSLMRGYKKMLQEGKAAGAAYGVFLFDGKTSR